MATIKASNNPVPSVQDKMTRNKRKYRTDQSTLSDSTTPNFPTSQIECPNYSQLDKSCEGFNLEHLASVCDMCKTLMCSPEERLDFEDISQDADWSEFTESRLEEILMGNLDLIFNNAIKLVSSYGYTEEIATNAVLEAGALETGKNSLTSMVDNALTLLTGDKELTKSLNPIEDLAELEKCILKKMISLVNESQPFFSTGDAMWCLLICDMNVPRACNLDYDGPNINENNAINSQNDTQNETASKVLGLPIPNSRSPSISSNVWSVISNLKPDENPNPNNPDHNNKKEGCNNNNNNNKKGANIRKEAMLRNKSMSLEKSLRALGSKAASKACKHGVPANLVLDRKCKYTASDSSTGITVKSTFKLSKLMGGGVLRKDAVLDLSFHAKKTSSNNNNNKNENNSKNENNNSNNNSSGAANTDLSLSIQSAIGPNNDKDANNNSSNNNNNKDLFKEWVPQDKKDEVALKLVPHMRELQAQMQDWTDWAQQKVMEAARRLAKDKEELQSLRQEKDEASRQQDEKKCFEESTRKKLAEMEAAISKAGGQVERANAAARRLKLENSSLRLEMEAAKKHAADTAADCRELSKNEAKTMKKFQSWETQRGLLQDELATEMSKLAHLQRMLEQAKQQHNQLQARLQQEQRAKTEAMTQVNSLKKEREQVEMAARAEENSLMLRAENDLQRFKGEIRSLEQQIQQLRLAAPDSSKLPRWAPQVSHTNNNKSYAAKLKNNSNNNNNNNNSNNSNNNSNNSYNNRARVIQEVESEEVQRERECVMCLSEEMSVVFLPCAHQVVCVKCNEMHEGQGMKDCPSCRAPIQRRIVVRCADS